MLSPTNAWASDGARRANRAGTVAFRARLLAVADADYVKDESVGAKIGQEALRKALETALLNPVGLLHVHMHDFPGPLWFSRIDLREQLNFVPDFSKSDPICRMGRWSWDRTSLPVGLACA